ncbi:MAG: WG repeat-containing protein [Endomicrobia bacterium]|nr:WG repeat-containing protein [Endomicrobiia bacterium]
MKKIIFIITLFICANAPLYPQDDGDYLIPFAEMRGDTQYFGYETCDRNEIIKAKYRIAYTDKMHKMAIVMRDDGQWIGIDRNDNVILYPFIYDNGPDYVFEGLFRFVDNDKIGFANLDGDKIIPAEFDFVEPFQDGLAEYAYGGHSEYDHLNEHWAWTGAAETGYINKYGQRFIKIIKTEEGRVACMKDNRRFYIDDKGKIIKAVKAVVKEE